MKSKNLSAQEEVKEIFSAINLILPGTANDGIHDLAYCTFVFWISDSSSKHQKSTPERKRRHELIRAAANIYNLPQLENHINFVSLVRHNINVNKIKTLLKFPGFSELVRYFHAENGLEKTNIERMHAKCRQTQLSRVISLLEYQP